MRNCQGQQISCVFPRFWHPFPDEAGSMVTIFSGNSASVCFGTAILPFAG